MNTKFLNKTRLTALLILFFLNVGTAFAASPKPPKGGGGPLAQEQATREAADLLLQTNIDNISLTPGPQGAVGTPGAIGPQGADGTPGVAGPQGAGGTPGAKGDTGLLDLDPDAFIDSSSTDLSIGMKNPGTTEALVHMFDSSSYQSGDSYALKNTFTFNVTAQQKGYLNQLRVWAGNNQNPFGAHLQISRVGETILDQSFTGLKQVPNSWEVVMSFTTSILVNQGDVLTISFTPSKSIGFGAIFIDVPGMTMGTINGYGQFFARIRLLALSSFTEFKPRIILTKDGDLIMKDFIRANKTVAEAKGTGAIYIENGFLKVVP